MGRRRGNLHANVALDSPSSPAGTQRWKFEAANPTEPRELRRYHQRGRLPASSNYLGEQGTTGIYPGFAGLIHDDYYRHFPCSFNSSLLWALGV